MKFPTIKSKKDSLYITLFFLFSIACIRAFKRCSRPEPVGGCDPEKYGGHEADGRESHCGERL